jgi:hypothetical protein
MKTTTLFPVLAFALIFGAAMSASSATPYGSDEFIGMSPVIQYRVNIHLTGDVKLCNLYYVEMVDSHGRLVAPPKIYNPGVSVYTFFERGPVRDVRAAYMVLADRHSHYICPTELVTEPREMAGPFLNGQTYVFDLYPASPAIDDAVRDK